MEILYFDKLDSTHKYLLNKLKNQELKLPIVVLAKEQIDGIGTRGKRWQSLKGNLFLSIGISRDFLPKDLPLQSVGIYFAYIFKELLAAKGSKIWLKWPNDLYLNSKKVGGVLVQIVSSKVIISIGLNIKQAPSEFEIIDIKIEKYKLIEEFLLKVKEVITWKKIFSKYQVEFNKSRAFTATFKKGLKLSLKEAVLYSDGSIKINGKRIYYKDE